MSLSLWSTIRWRRGKTPPVCLRCSRSLTLWPPASPPCTPPARREEWRPSTWVSVGLSCVTVSVLFNFLFRYFYVFIYKYKYILYVYIYIYIRGGTVHRCHGSVRFRYNMKKKKKSTMLGFIEISSLFIDFEQTVVQIKKNTSRCENTTYYYMLYI